MSEQLPTRIVRDVEIASTRDGIDITRGYTGPLLVPADRILRNRGGGDLAVYEQVLSDPQVMSTFRDRRNAVVKCEWSVQAASDRRIDRKAADHIREQLQRVGWDRITDRMLFGVFYGFAVSEIMYGVQDGLVCWDAIKVRNRRRFRYTPEGELRMLTMQNMFEGVALPGAKFWHLATGADNDDEPYGLGLGHWCYWPVLFKRNGLKFWLTFIEKFAAPTGIGEYDSASATADDQRKLLAAVQAIQTDSGIIIPKGMEVRLLEAARSGSVDYKALHEVMDATIAKTVVGQTASSQGTPGRLGNDELQGDVRADLVKADADLICESLNLGPVKWLTRWNFPGADLPRVYREIDVPEDLSARATRDKTISSIGFRPTLAYIHDTYGGEWVEKAAEPEEPLVDVPPVPPAFAAPADTEATHDAPAAAARLLDANLQPTVTNWIESVRTLANKVDSLEELRDGVLALAPEMSLVEFSAAMQHALTAATLAGRYDIVQEAQGGAGRG